MIIIKNKKLLVTLGVFFITFLFTGCFLPDVPQPIDEARLTSIAALPSSMYIKIGKSKAITSVTAYYDDGTDVNIALNACTYRSNKSNATVSSSGLVTGISSCSATTPVSITVTYTEESITVTDTVLVVVTNPSPGWGG